MFNIVEVVSRNRFSFFANRGASHNTVLVFFALDGFFTKSHKIGANCRTSGNRKTPQRKNDPRKKQGFTSLSDHRSSIFWILVNRIKASKTNKKTNAKKAWISNPQKTHAEIDAPESKYKKTHIQLKPEPIEKSKTNTPLNFKYERVLALISFPSDLHGERLFVSSEENVRSCS